MRFPRKLDKEAGYVRQRNRFAEGMKQNKTTNIAAGTDVLTMQLFEPDPNILYPLEMVQHLARIPRRMILTYCRRGLISPVIDRRTHPTKPDLSQ